MQNLIQYTEYRIPTFLSTTNRRHFTVYFKRPQFRMFKIEVCCTWSQTSLASSSTSNTSSRVKFSWLSGPWLHIFLHTVPKIICYLCIKTKPSTAVANATVYVWFLHQIYFNKSRGHISLHLLKPSQTRFLCGYSYYFLGQCVPAFIQKLLAAENKPRPPLINAPGWGERGREGGVHCTLYILYTVQWRNVMTV